MLRPHRAEQQPVTGGSNGKTVVLIIASTRAAGGVYPDDAGPQLVQWLRSKGYVPPTAQVVADNELAATLAQLMSGPDGALPDVLITSDGTGISPTDQSVEAVAPAVDVV